MPYPNSLVETLPMLVKGMFGIFLVIGTIALITWLFNKLFH